MRWLNYSHLTSPIAYRTVDTQILLHAVDATSRGASGISVHSPDTGVLAIAVRRYPLLCPSITFGTGQKRRSIPLNPIYDALSPMNAVALPGFHAISGCDNTGSLSGKAKATFWKAFKHASDNSLQALGALGSREVELPSFETCDAIEKFICGVCQPKADVSKLSKLRWRMFCMKQANSYKLPPTRAAKRSIHSACLPPGNLEQRH